MASHGLWRDAKHNYFASYADGVKFGPVSGVTGAIGIIDKPAIVGWAKNEVAGAAVRNYEMLGQLIATGGGEGASKWLAGIPGYQRDKAADTGTLVHILVEKIVRQQQVDIPEDLAPYAAAFNRWLTDAKPEIVTTEALVANEKVMYGGTLDLIAKIDGQLWLIDAKTWKREPRVGSDMYAETALQLAAYANATFIGAPDDPQRHRFPTVEAHGVLHLRPDLYQSGYRLIPFDVGPAEWLAFRAALALSNWKRERAKVVIGSNAAKELVA